MNQIQKKRVVHEIVCFFYYTGHGIIRVPVDKKGKALKGKEGEEETCAVCLIPGSPGEYEYYVLSGIIIALLEKKGIIVISPLDCCRGRKKVPLDKGDSDNPPLLKVDLRLYAVRSNFTAKSEMIEEVY